jgi:hypothetical protein
MTKAVTFDFWGTLIRDSPENIREQRALRIRALQRVLAGAGSGIGETASPGISRVLLKAPPAARQTCRVSTRS